MDNPRWPWILIGMLLLVLAGSWAASTLGGGDIEIPDVTGMSFGVAKQEIERAGLLVGETEYVADYDATEFGDDQIVEQTPEPGEFARLGDKVDLVVTGSAP